MNDLYRRAPNDADLVDNLPKAVQLLSKPDAPLIWGEYDPCYWNLDDKDAIIKALTDSGWSVI
jgi:hypothetical protein